MKKIILAGVLATMMGSAPVMAATATTTTPAQATTANVQKEAEYHASHLRLALRPA